MYMLYIVVILNTHRVLHSRSTWEGMGLGRPVVLKVEQVVTSRSTALASVM